GQVWVMGDNRSDSKDSRYFGSIDQSTIVGRAFVTVWPLGRFGLL
ncbi:MAG: signal peptidase I, partial [Actinobacteria bacterium]|nr:signal peptidase I [Actinomycetota bacterium]